MFIVITQYIQRQVDTGINDKGHKTMPNTECYSQEVKIQHVVSVSLQLFVYVWNKAFQINTC